MIINNTIVIKDEQILSQSINNENLTENTLTIRLDYSLSAKDFYDLLKPNESKELIITNDNDEILFNSVLNRIYIDYSLNALIFKMGEGL